MVSLRSVAPAGFDTNAVLSDLEADVPKSRLECLLRVDLGHSRHDGPFNHPERPDLADSRLSHRNIVGQCSESVQKAANGKNRPSRDIQRLIWERLLSGPKAQHSCRSRLVRLSVRKPPTQLKLLLPRHERQGIGWLEGRNWLGKDARQGNV